MSALSSASPTVPTLGCSSKAWQATETVFAPHMTPIRDLNRRLDVEMEAETDRVFDAIMSRSA
ncbi:hypothetical protein AB0N62_42130 [Streptomyces sp. NPDC093982]|uniref:hypothetical protein n=1 Tax=Streptomyces sp. NPDC093982 TaxID=3155077 RepID=UPI00342E5792